MAMRLLTIALIVAIACAVGCSSGLGVNPVIPNEQAREASSDSSHQLWGLFQFKANPDAGTLYVVPFRDAAMHLNALQFLEPPLGVNLSVTNLKFNGNIIDCDVGLRHPFLGLTKFTGFDVCGILITSGNVTGYSDPDIRMAGDGDTRLLNPDGYTRWWNPSEFPVNNGTMFSYKDGLLGTPDSVANFNCNINAYKYFCDDLDPDEPLTGITVERRGLFSAGSKNIRHYTIELGAGLICNYAVDANWLFPQGGAPWDVPGDFPEGANRAEAYRLEITEVENTLWNDGEGSGGGLSLSIDVYDHFKADMNAVKVESPGSFAPVTETVATGTGTGFATYNIDILDATPLNSGEIELLITVESEATGYQDMLAGKAQCAYFTYATTVDDEEPFQGNCPDVVNEAYSYTQTPTTQDWRWAYLMPIVSGDTFAESCIDFDFLNNNDDRLVVNGRDSLNQIGAITPLLYNEGQNPEVYITGVETCSIDCDLTDRIVYVLFDDSVLSYLPDNSLDKLIPRRTDVVKGADTAFHVYDISEAAEIGSGYNIGAKIWAIETDANDNIWVLDENLYMHLFVNNGDSYTESTEKGFDINDTVPDFEGIAYDFAIDYYNEAFYILTNGSENGILYRIECDGEFINPIEGNQNPLVNVWEYKANDRADIVIDNLDSDGKILQGEQDAQILCVANLPGDQWGFSWMASKIGITRPDAALGSVVKYTFTGVDNVGYGACCGAINGRTNTMFTKCGPPYGNQYIVQQIFIPSGEWY